MYEFVRRDKVAGIYVAVYRSLGKPFVKWEGPKKSTRSQKDPTKNWTICSPAFAHWKSSQQSIPAYWKNLVVEGCLEFQSDQPPHGAGASQCYPYPAGGNRIYNSWTWLFHDMYVFHFSWLWKKLNINIYIIYMYYVCGMVLYRIDGFNWNMLNLNLDMHPTRCHFKWNRFPAGELTSL